MTTAIQIVAWAGLAVFVWSFYADDIARWRTARR